ncbi:hypothetical protein WICMUC_003857 [Wickerhamomyces mucosus]|uniref:Nudix hydrolase domain-containing protein n=1 Tax=Wickerhamomyces mucosus TaxID=1378264 RepID=A0A9P8TB91_9ASCO|nr:hypothetical protein WICMUC_003857 [Wickerhamomyces mucosus]
MSLLKIIDRVDNFTYDTLPSNLYLLKTHDDQNIIGYITESVAQELIKFPEFITLQNGKELKINSNLDSREKRNSIVNKVAQSLKQLNKFETLKGWRDELYTVYYPSKVEYFQAERAFCPLLGLIMYGVHINGYIPKELSSDGQLKFWVQRRSKTKATFPGLLDNTIAGGLGYPHGIYETAIKESYEEAGINKEYIIENLTQSGVVSYIYQNDQEGGLIQPEIEYIFDLKFDETTIPTPIDNEAEEFVLMTVDEIKIQLLNGEFKPNSGLVIVDFLIRHGLIKFEDDENYTDIVLRSHRPPPFPTK